HRLHQLVDILHTDTNDPSPLCVTTECATEPLNRHSQGIRPSIGSVGDAYDNAVMEAINGLYKSECIRTKVFHEGPWRTVSDVEYATAAWVDWYNNRRLHSTLGMISPTEFETAHYADTESRAD
ncbi:integrase core domain-containing protein, partial [Streptomyces sp. NPDC057686]|uniref:integrase core domain-containing protein n=1 Tax=Streptomyces sp. NPDC057686 TaxID=3346212 RepID=UPI0036C1DE33